MGRPTWHMFHALEASQWWSPVALAELQRVRLNRLLRDALAHSPWHATRIREAGLAGLTAAGEVGLDDLRRLPRMTKSDARLNVEDLVWRGVPGGAHPYNTGGSSGEPLIFYYGRERQAADAAARLRARQWWGVAPGEKELYLWGAPTELSRLDRVKRWRDSLVNHRILNAFAMSAPRMDAYLEAMERWAPRSIYGYASSLALLAAHARARGQRPRLPRLKVVCTTGEPLYPHQRELIASVFGVPVANEYGCRDGGLIAHEAPGGQMLMVSEFNLVEVLDPAGNAVPPGTPGELVLTGLCSAAQPFIRYRTGDIVTLSAETALHGRGLPVIAEIAGRSTDYVVRADGTIMHALALIYVLRAIPGVSAFKCIQHTPTYMEVQIVPGPGWTAADGAAIEAGLRERLGEALQVALALQEEIPAEASGKHRYVVSHVALPESLQAFLPSQTAG
ncbi:MAG: hypothetical protein RL434_1628 [Pseudomonadota bacterium]